MKTPILQNPCDVHQLVDWGPVTTMIEGQSHTSGVLLHKGPNGEAESGIWVCTPGYWHCHVTSDEFCHFLLGPWILALPRDIRRVLPLFARLLHLYPRVR